MTMSKEVLEIFRPEIDEAERKGERKSKIEMVRKLYRMDFPMSQIIEVTELTEEDVLNVLKKNK